MNRHYVSLLSFTKWMYLARSSTCFLSKSYRFFSAIRFFLIHGFSCRSFHKCTSNKYSPSARLASWNRLDTSAGSSYLYFPSGPRFRMTTSCQYARFWVRSFALCAILLDSDDENPNILLVLWFVLAVVYRWNQRCGDVRRLASFPFLLSFVFLLTIEGTSISPFWWILCFRRSRERCVLGWSVLPMHSVTT